MWLREIWEAVDERKRLSLRFLDVENASGRYVDVKKNSRLVILCRTTAASSGRMTAQSLQS